MSPVHRLSLLGLTATSLALSSVALAAPPMLGDLFQDHMVLPRHQATVFGQAAAGEQVKITFATAATTAIADKTGHFQAVLPDIAAGDNGDLTVTAASGTQALHDVIAGDVFLCSGQSNMQLPVTRSLNEDVVIDNSTNDNLRMVTVATSGQASPQAHLASPAVWEKASPQTTGHWSATCYYFAVALQDRLHIPIGLVNASVGGSGIAAWTSYQGLKDFADYKDSLPLVPMSVSDPAAAGALLGHRFEAWWRKGGGAVDPAPWQATAAEMKTWTPVPDISKKWETWGVADLANYDGPVWYAAHVTLTADQAKQAKMLDLGLIDDIDYAWVNGQPVGYIQGNTSPHSHALTPGLFKAGDNVVVLNVIDLWSLGGMNGDGPRAVTLASGEQVPLTGWVYREVPQNLKYPPRAPWDLLAGLTILDNGMIAPLGPFRFKTALWYQGESDVGNNNYQALLGNLMSDWRRQFGPDLPFAVVQLANNGERPTSPGWSGWARLREAERLAVLADDNATLATAVDIGEPSDVHPANKIELGRRLARAVAVKAYGVTGLSESGPQVASVTRVGDTVVVAFNGTEGDLIAYGAVRPIGFELCKGDDCRYAEGDLAGTTVVLQDAGDATSVRFCWADAPVCTLYDGTSRLPALPFEQAIK